MGFEGFDQWRAHDASAERDAPPCEANDNSGRLRVPRYKLVYWHDSTLRAAQAELRIMTIPREGWRTLDSVTIWTRELRDEDVNAEVVRRLREHRRLTYRAAS